MPIPIEVVVIRDLVRVARPEPTRAESDEGSSPSPRPSAEQTRELLAMVEAVHCDVRQQILLDLAAGGRANVGLLAERTGIDPKKLSSHLGKLKDLGLVFSQREGKEIWYEAAPDRVRYERHDDGRFSLTVTARGSGVSVTLAVGVSGVNERAT